MTELERLELALRRIAARRKIAHELNGEPLNIDIQNLLDELATELAIVAKARG